MERSESSFDKRLRLMNFADPKVALAGAEEEIGKSPKNSDWWELKAVALKRLGRLNDALQAIDYALTLSEIGTEKWRTRAEILTGLNRLAEAQAATLKIQEIEDMRKQGLFPQCQYCMTKIPKIWIPNPLFPMERWGFCSVECEQAAMSKRQAGIKKYGPL